MEKGGTTKKNLATYQLQHTTRHLSSLVPFFLYPSLAPLLLSFSVTNFLLFLLPDLFLSSSFSLFDLFCMNDFVVETPAFLGVVFFSGQSIRVDAKSNLIFEWRCAQCQVLVALKCELFSTSF